MGSTSEFADLSDRLPANNHPEANPEHLPAVEMRHGDLDFTKLLIEGRRTEPPLQKNQDYIGTQQLAFLSLVEGTTNAPEKQAEKEEAPHAPTDHKEWKDELGKLADRELADPKAKELFKSDLSEMEKRVSEGKLSPAEAENTYKQISRIMTRQSQVGVSAENRMILARQVLHQAAHPETIDQGAYDNCNVAAPEVRMYYRAPSAMAKLVADSALTGKYTDSTGKTVDITRSVQPANEGHLKVPEGENERSYASQLYHVAAINLVMKDKFNNANLEYVQKHAKDGDPGARVIDKSFNPPKEIYGFGADGKPIYESQMIKDEKGNPVLDNNLRPTWTGPMNNPGLTIQDGVNLMEKITGQKEVGAAIASYQNGGHPNNWIWDKIGLSAHVPNDGRIPVFENQAQLTKILDDAKRNGIFPIVVQVNTGSGFLGKQVEEASGKPLGGEGSGFGGGHVLCIKDYDPSTGKVELDNTWGRSRDKIGKDAVTVKDVLDISNADPKLQAAEKHYHDDINAAYKDWCRYFNKTQGRDYPPASMGHAWLQRYQRMHQ